MNNTWEYEKFPTWEYEKFPSWEYDKFPKKSTVQRPVDPRIYEFGMEEYWTSLP